MKKLENFYKAFQENDTTVIEEGFNTYRKRQSASVIQTSLRIKQTPANKSAKENR
ncbi:MAG: hypothetical protein K2N95_19085 [Lachnospiraceae bacterium]|nr:hypothetical protein [Lachnospiraceae bacterium]